MDIHGDSAHLTTADLRFLLGALIVTGGSATLHYTSAGLIAPFVVSAIALGVLASLVGRSVDRLGDRLGSGATGVVQSALGNLPELFIGIFALRAGLIAVLQSALIGSVLANLLLVLGLAFVAGGLRHGVQRFTAEPARLAVLLLVVSVAIVMVPTLSSHLGSAARLHERALSNVAAVVLLIVFVVSIPASLRRSEQEGQGPLFEGPIWPLWLVIAVLTASSVGAAFVSDWFIGSLTPALRTLHVTPVFAGLVIVAIAGNAVENFVGIKLAIQDRPDYALSLILQSPVQIAIGLLPALVLLSNVVGHSPFTLVMPTMLAAALALGTIVAVVVVFDGESTWLEGVTLIGLYVTIATAFWWG